MKRLMNVLIGLALTVCALGIFFLIAETIMYVFHVSIPPKSGYVITLPGPFSDKDSPDPLIGEKGYKLHPYLGLTNPSYKDRSKDQHGTPIDLKETTCNIGIFGGSVAMYFAEYEKAHKNIINYLANRYAKSRCQNFSIVNFGIGGGVAPMTLYAFIHNIDIIDAAIIIDGYNEIGTGGLDPTIYPTDYPPYFYYVDFLYLSAKRVEQDTFKIQFYMKLYKTTDRYSNTYLVKKSRFLQYLSHRVLSKLGTQIMALIAERAKKTYWASIEGNKRGFVNPNGQLRLRQEIWKKNAFLMQKIGRLYSVPVIHILQAIPEPATKTFTVEEKKWTRVDDPSYNEVRFSLYKHYSHYGHLIQELSEFGVTVHDFRMVFKDYKGQAYRDPIHYTDDGNEIVAKKVVGLMDQVFTHEFPGRHGIRVDFSTILNEGE